MRRRIHTDLGAHIAAIYDNGYLDSFIPVPRGPIQDESKMSDEDEARVARQIEAGTSERIVGEALALSGNLESA